jgi:glycerol-3-phosphate dehydrogenase (NAD(P)+)
MKIAVLGSGSWGTALAVLLARNGHDVTLAGRDEEEIGFMQSHRENIRYMPGFVLPNNVDPVFFEDLSEDFEVYVVAVPSSVVAEVMRYVKGVEPIVLLASKGLEPGTGALVSEVAAQRLGPGAKLAALSGPNLATEVMKGVPTATVIACPDLTLGGRLAAAFNCRTLRAYLSPDLVGVELAGALKNVIAIGGGMSDGLGFGDNTKGALVARGLLEMARLGRVKGADPGSFLGIAGVGDLFATANSKLSRNYRLGYALGSGASLKDALESLGQVAEGVPTSEAALVLARKHMVQIPIMETIAGVIRGRVSARDAVQSLMERDPKPEGWEAILH